MPIPNNVSRKRQGFPPRSSKRVNARIKVTIEWKDEHKSSQKEGYTLDVSQKGCLVVVPENLVLGQRVRVTNRVNHQSTEAIVVWKGAERPEGRELGMELVNPATDFWGVEF